MEQLAKEFLTPRELAEKLGMSLRFVEENTYLRKIPGAVKIGRVWRYRVAEVEKALLSGSFLLQKEPKKPIYPRRVIVRRAVK